MQQDDNEMESWLAEVKLMARRRIGEISKNLDTIKPVDRSAYDPSAGTISSKQETLKEVGISTSAANRILIALLAQ
jgi:hypothetical protein